jgi:hypothetical protein
MQRTSLWQDGALFHSASRYPRRADARRVDRLAGILRNGLIAPACCEDGSVCSDLQLTITGTNVPYDSLIFLHRYGPRSSLYTWGEVGRFMVFVDPALPVMTPEDMGGKWVILCQDEVYVRDRIAPEWLTAVAVHRADSGSIRAEFTADFERLRIPLWTFDGEVIWKPHT